MTEASWQPDPTGRHELRYWDGQDWTDHVSDAGVTASDPVGAPAAPSMPATPAAPSWGQPSAAQVPPYAPQPQAAPGWAPATGTPPPNFPQAGAPPSGGGSKTVPILIGVGVLAAAGVGAFFLLSGGDDDKGGGSGNGEFSASITGDDPFRQSVSLSADEAIRFRAKAADGTDLVVTLLASRDDGFDAFRAGESIVQLTDVGPDATDDEIITCCLYVDDEISGLTIPSNELALRTYDSQIDQPEADWWVAPSDIDFDIVVSTYDGVAADITLTIETKEDVGYEASVTDGNDPFLTDPAFFGSSPVSPTETTTIPTESSTSTTSSIPSLPTSPGIPSGPPGGNQSVFDLEIGMCVGDTADEATLTELPQINCTRPHYGEVYALFDVADAAAFPGSDAIQQQASEGCLAAFEPYVGRDYPTSVLDVNYLVPTDSTWVNGDREVVCIAYNLDGSPLTGSVQGSGI